MNNKKSIILKGLLGLFLFTFFLFMNDNTAKAETKDEIANSDIVAINSSGAEQIDWDNILAALEQRDITDGESFTVDGKYHLYCEVILTPNAVPDNNKMSIASTITNNYTATCNVYISTSVQVAVLTHTVNISYFDTGKVHINSGSLSVNTLRSTWTGTAYGYTINNTDGSYSNSYGMVQLYDSSAKLYYYYGGSVTVTPEGGPVFDFKQV